MTRPDPAADPFAGPALTALGLAAARSVENGRPDRLVVDPWARRLFEAARVDLPMLLDWPERTSPPTPAQALHLHGSLYIGLRTRFYDDALLEAVRRGISQAVMLGAGLCTRAYRMALPATLTVFQVDRAPLLAWKRDQLQRLGACPGCAVRDVGVDLREDWPASLRAAGHDQHRSTLFLAEGLLAYLPAAEQARLLGQIETLAAPGSRLAGDRISGDPAADGRLDELSRRSGIDMSGLIAGGEAGQLGRGLAERGWAIAELSTAELAERYGRDLSDPFADPGAPAAEPPWLDTVFLTGQRD